VRPQSGSRDALNIRLTHSPHGSAGNEAGAQAMPGKVALDAGRLQRLAFPPPAWEGKAPKDEALRDLGCREPDGEGLNRAECGFCCAGDGNGCAVLLLSVFERR
jgi:hypothetical protein